jgi:hypothetical protein
LNAIEAQILSAMYRALCAHMDFGIHNAHGFLGAVPRTKCLVLKPNRPKSAERSIRSAGQFAQKRTAAAVSINPRDYNPAIRMK